MVESRWPNLLTMASSTAAGMLSGMDDETKVRENRLRRVAARRMLTLSKTRRRDPRAFDYGSYLLTDSRGTEVHRSPDLDDIEQFLGSYDARAVLGA